MPLHEVQECTIALSLLESFLVVSGNVGSPCFGQQKTILIQLGPTLVDPSPSWADLEAGPFLHVRRT